MWQKDLVSCGVKAVGRAAKPFFISRTIRQTGNKMPRTIIKGFTGPNIEAKEHFRKLFNLQCRNIRPIIAGFTGRPNMGRLNTVPGNKAFVKFFPKFRIPKMTRHVVFDVKTSRISVTGFKNATPEIITNGSFVPTPVNPLQRPEIATERVVIQGFGGNSSKPVIKQVPTAQISPRTVVKGFLG